METHLVVVVAGHIDHGKTMLVRALTGVDTDRLAEEKRRGMTIELGFAPLEFESGRVMSFIDVPGHERLVHTMIAGAAGVAAMLLVVAADEGIMPQTTEHAQICRGLGIQHAVVALTKTDKVDAEWLDLVRDTVAEWLQQQGWGSTPIVPVSARTGAGLNELKAALEDLWQRVQPRANDGLARVAVDRSFALPGYGTIVTGTLRDGPLEQGAEVMVYPRGQRVTIRQIQTHGRAVHVGTPGARTALNLAGIHYQDVGRGDWIALPASMQVHDRWLASLHWIQDAWPRLRPGTRVHLHHGTLATVARLYRVSADACLVQLECPRPLAGRAGDRIVLRQLSPLQVLAWGELIMPMEHRPRSRARREEIGQRWHEWLELTEPERWFRWAQQAGPRGRTLQEALAWSGRAPKYVRTMVEQLVRQKKVERFEVGNQVWWIDRSALERLRERARTRLEEFLAAHPLRARMRWETWLQQWRPDERDLWHVVATRWTHDGWLVREGHDVTLVDHASRTRDAPLTAIQGLLERIKSSGFSGLSQMELAEAARSMNVAVNDLVEFLRDRYHVALLDAEGQRVLVGADAINAFQGFLQKIPPPKRLTIQDVKQFLGVSRKVVIGYLQYARDRGWLRREGSQHRVLL